jgi:hypothetical protein
MERMHNFEDLKPGARLLGLDPAGIAEVVQVARFGSDALNLGWTAELANASSIVVRKAVSSYWKPDEAMRSTRMAACVSKRSGETDLSLPKTPSI